MSNKFRNINYTKTGHMARLLLSPEIEVYPEEWKELDKVALPLEDRLHFLRTRDYNTCAPHPNLEEIRLLRVELSRIDKEMHKILMLANPKFNTYWFNDNES